MCGEYETLLYSTFASSVKLQQALYRVYRVYHPTSRQQPLQLPSTHFCTKQQQAMASAIDRAITKLDAILASAGPAAAPPAATTSRPLSVRAGETHFLRCTQVMFLIPPINA